MTIPLHVTALPADALDRIRARGADDVGNPLVPVPATGGETPLHCCLTEAADSDAVVLIAWQPSTLPTPYSEVGPVFVHAERCAGPVGTGNPEAFRGRRQLFRAYDAQGRQVDNEVHEGADAEPALSALLGRPEVAYVHSRNVYAGCYMFRVDRAA